MPSSDLTHGSLFSGIGGFDLGFERAGIQTAWQVEIDPICRAVLEKHFPLATRYSDVRTATPFRVDVISGGFPCQDISTMGKRKGLSGERSRLFHHAIRIIEALKPEHVVLENVPNLLFSNNGEDFKTVIRSLAECGYMGAWRVLDAQYFGIPQARRRLYILARLGQMPSVEFLGDADTMENVSGARQSALSERPPPVRTLLAGFDNRAISLGANDIVAVPNGWGEMVFRERVSATYGLPLGLDAANFKERQCAGNAVCPPIAEWIGRIINKK